MDSYFRFSYSIPRYIVIISAEYVSGKDICLFQELAKSQYAASSCTRTRSGDTSCSTVNTSQGQPQQDQNVWVSILVPEYCDESSDECSFYASGWRRLTKDDCFHGEVKDGHEGDKDDDHKTEKCLFAELKQKFREEINDLDALSEEKKREFASQLAPELDKLADSLPAGGFLLDVLWYMPASSDYPVLNTERPVAFLFAVLRRLMVWHGGRVTLILGKGVEEQPSLSHWKDFLGCQVVKSDAVTPNKILSSSESLAWQGQVKYISSRGTNFPPWPGFSLHRLEEDHRVYPFIEVLSTDNGNEVGQSQQSSQSPLSSDFQPKFVVDGTLEFVHLANLNEIPSWFILPGKFEVRLNDKEKINRFSRSCFWMRYLSHRLPGDGQGAICQLSCLEVDGPIPSASSQGLSTEAWTNAIMNDPLNPTVPDVQLKGTRHTFFFLVHGDRKGRCIASPLVSPYMLNGAAHALLAKSEPSEQTTAETASPSVSEVLGSIPTVSGRQLREEEVELARMQVKALTMVIAKIQSEGIEMNVTPSLLIFLFNYMRKIYYEGYRLDDPDTPSPPASPGAQEEMDVSQSSTSDSPQTRNLGARTRSGRVRNETVVAATDVEPVNTSSDDQDPEAARINLNEIPTELDQSPSHWVEREALQNRESIANRLRRLRSSDMMLGGISVPPPDNNTITLSAKEFLKHFKPNGQPKKEDLVLSRPAVRHSPRTRSATASRQSGPSAEELRETKFPDAVKINYHGIHYCLDAPDSHSLDRRLVRLQQRCVRHETACTFTSHQQPTIAIKTKRTLSNSPSDQKTKMRKLSTSSKRQQQSTNQTTPLRGATPKKKTPRSRRKRNRQSTTGGLTPKRVKRTPQSSTKPVDMTSPRRSARKAAMRHQSSSSSSSAFLAPSSSSCLPAAASSSSGKSKERGELSKDDMPLEKMASRRSSLSAESRSEKHKRKLRSIVEETLKTKGIDSSHACYKQCITRLYTQTKSFIKDLKTSKGLYEEMRKVAEANVDFVVRFELQRVASKP